MVKKALWHVACVFGNLMYIGLASIGITMAIKELTSQEWNNSFYD